MSPIADLGLHAQRRRAEEHDRSIRVVEQMLDHAANARWASLPDVLTDDFVIVEPPSLPYGGEHHGVDGYVALMQRITELFALQFEVHGLHALDASTVLLRMHVTFTGRTTHRTRRFAVLEVLTTREGRVARSEVFLSDTATLLTLLPIDPDRDVSADASRGTRREG